MKPTRRTRPARKHWPICPETGKQRLGERKDAHLVLRAARARRATAARDGVTCRWTIQRSYHCHHCDGWHTTSQPARKPA